MLVFAEQPLEGRLEEQGPETLLVVIPGAVLDASAPARVAGAPGAGVRMVTAEEAAGAAGPEVRLRIARTPGPPAELTRRGATLAIELARPRRARADGIAMKFTSANLAEVVEKVARATGQRFIYDDTLQGLVTLTSPDLVSPEEALELLHTVLLMKGYAAVPTPTGARKILPLGEGVAGAPWNPAAPGAQSEALTATLVRLRDAPAERVATALQPWVGATALAIAHPPSNALILAGSEARLRELLTLVAAIDQASDRPLVVRRLRHRSGRGGGGAPARGHRQARRGAPRRRGVARRAHRRAGAAGAARADGRGARLPGGDRPARSAAAARSKWSRCGTRIPRRWPPCSEASRAGADRPVAARPPPRAEPPRRPTAGAESLAGRDFARRRARSHPLRSSCAPIPRRSASCKT